VLRARRVARSSRGVVQQVAEKGGGWQAGDTPGEPEPGGEGLPGRRPGHDGPNVDPGAGDGEVSGQGGHGRVAPSMNGK
jgi:hypothetical protein